MRDTFFSTLESMMYKNDSVVFLTADMGFKLFSSIAKKYPNRVINVGIREAAMIGVAAGLSKEGFLPFVYSIVPFITLRTIEQTRNDLCYNELFTCLVGVGGGLAYGINGPTHMGIEDISVMSALPNMTIVSPCDSFETRSLMPQIIKSNGPVYLRLARNREPLCHKNSDPTPKIGCPSIIKNGKDAVIFSYGQIVHDILSVVNELERNSKASFALISCHTIKPLADKMILNLIKEGTPIIVIEEHVPQGGLGSQLALLCKKNAVENSFYHLHLPDEYPNICGDRDYLLKYCKLSKGHIKTFLANSIKKD